MKIDKSTGEIVLHHFPCEFVHSVSVDYVFFRLNHLSESFKSCSWGNFDSCLFDYLTSVNFLLDVVHGASGHVDACLQSVSDGVTA
ncbi:hypothetical protein PFISCL1PPCAC_25331 [Pristionchus fissidentatus]|uniref:Uncharacterized protein n=1 Tax=Pristionchus fissidentatus TaxID=1538716 RepID=A0AAV5WTM3_9BILA|nr:hypothetical protein PFISCL1PPCAC_25331 [Pristionchus fissidentatus]